jgi:hypothetical protein
MAIGDKFTINLAPKWSEMLPIYLERLLDPSSADLHSSIRSDLRRMADMADITASKAGHLDT